MKTIILIEDDSDIRETTTELLELANYKVFSAENGKQGIQLAKTIKADLILCDIMMPVMDGYGVLNILSRNPDTYNIPFIFLSAKTEKNDIRKGMCLGADDYITKPFEEVELITAIETRIQRSENLKKKSNDTTKEVYDLVKNSEGLSQLKETSSNRKHRVYKKKETIYREGDHINYLYMITKGRVKCISMDCYGKYFVNDIHGKGEFLGYTSLLDENEFQESAIAMVDTEVNLIPKQDFVQLIQKNKKVANEFIKILSENVLKKEKRLLQLAYSPLRERLASTLLELIEKEQTQNNSTDLVISREDLASIVGTAKESLIRTLSDLKKEGLVETEGQRIRILDNKRLKKVTASF